MTESSPQGLTLPRKRNFLLIIIFILCLSFASIVAMANDNTVVVESHTLNVRQGPGLSHDIITQVEQNDRLQVIERQNEWIKVRLDDNEIGWVASWLVHQPEITTESQREALVTGETVNIRSQASTEGEILGIVERGDQLNVVYQDGNWSQIVYNDQVAWINSYYISFTDQEEGEAEPTHSATIRINDVDTNVRAEPTTDSEQIGTAPAYTEYPYLSTSSGWHKIQFTEDTVGYVADFLVELDGQAVNEASSEAPEESTIPISEATIVIDAGHGGHDPGAVNGEIYEKNLTLSTAQKLQSNLLNSGANVILTRSDDEFVALDERVYESINQYADAFISLHYDAAAQANSMSGTTTYYYSESDLPLAESVNTSMINNGVLSNNGVRTGNYYVLRNNPRPALLLELGYMNNDTDLNYIYTSEYQDIIADAIYIGLLDYFE